MDIHGFRTLIESEIKGLEIPKVPAELYEPVRYILSLGGKRLRPQLLLAACHLAGGSEKDAIAPALGIEVFHNFTLLHDDIMDNAPLRRNQPTVHEKWNTSIAILSGDVMYTLACSLMSQAPDHKLRKVLDVFFSNAAAVCEGQQLDMNFETQTNVSQAEYLEMIRLKTAVLLGASLQIGALCGGASEEDAQVLYQAGCNAGIAFQLQDDLLDVFGDPKAVGKRAGGDIVSNKKTILKIKALEKADQQLREQLSHWYSLSPDNPDEKIAEVRRIFSLLGLDKETEALADKYFASSTALIQGLSFVQNRKDILTGLLNQLRTRTF